MDFDQFTEQLFVEYYGENDFDGAIAFIQEHGGQFTEHEQLYYMRHWMMCLLTKVGRIEDALMQLQIAWIEGIWYSRIKLTKDPDLAPLQDHPTFRAYLSSSLGMQAKARLAIDPERMTITTDPAPENAPLLLALHGNHSDNEETIEMWSSATDDGVILSCIQSSQVCCIPVYEWDNLLQAEDEVALHYNALSKTYPTHSAAGIGGYSMGATIAFQIALEQIVPVTSFILVAPALTERTDWVELIETKRDAPLYGKILIDPFDPNYELLETLYPLFADNNILCEFELMGGMGHAYPEQFNQILADFAQKMK